MNCMELKATKTKTKKKAVVLGEKKKAAVLPVSPAKKKLRLGLTGKENDEKLNERILTTNKCEVTGWDKAYTNKGRVFYVREETADDWCTLSQTKTPEKSPSPESSPEPSPVLLTTGGTRCKSPLLSSACKYCKRFPCVVEDNQIDFWEKNDDLRSNLVDHNTARKELYYWFSGILWGVLGKGKRKRLPECVECSVRDQFPSPNGDYMGYYDHDGPGSSQESALNDNELI